MGAKLRGLWRAFAVRICSHVYPAVHGRSSRSLHKRLGRCCALAAGQCVRSFCGSSGALFNLASMEPALSSPAKKRRRTVLEAAAEGSLDIRASLQRGSAALPPTPSLSLPQTCALLGWNKSDLLAVESAWQGMPADPSPLLLAANLALLPTDFCRAFDIAAEGEDCASAASAQKLQVLVVAALGTARLWWEHQEAECLTESRLAPLGAAGLR